MTERIPLTEDELLLSQEWTHHDTRHPDCKEYYDILISKSVFFSKNDAEQLKQQILSDHSDHAIVERLRNRIKVIENVNGTWEDPLTGKKYHPHSLSPLYSELQSILGEKK